MDSGCHKLSENTWFVGSYNGDKVGCDACPRTDGRTDGRNVKIELEFWTQNSQFKSDTKYVCFYLKVQKKVVRPTQKSQYFCHIFHRYIIISICIGTLILS